MSPSDHSPFQDGLVRPPDDSPPLFELALVETDEAALVSIKIMPVAGCLDPDPLYYLFVDGYVACRLTFWVLILFFSVCYDLDEFEVKKFSIFNNYRIYLSIYLLATSF